VDTGSKMDDVVFEEFKGTGNMELVLDRRLSERRIYPAIDIAKSGTRNERLLLTTEEADTMDMLRKALTSDVEEATRNILDQFSHTQNNRIFLDLIRKRRLI
jgi:transcription termination factor Rho